MSFINPARSLKTLLADWATAVAGTTLPQPPAYDGPDVILTGLVEHTDHVRSGCCFVARVRTGTDGHPYIGRAIERGAALVLGQRKRAKVAADLGEVPYLEVEDTAVAEAWLAAAWHAFPSRQLVVIGVTGTDGKTTTVNLVYSILKAAGIGVGMLSTLKAAVGDDEEALALHVTTPEAPVVQAYLRRMADAGLTHCVLETTSHGLAQERVGAIDFDIVAITNITHEHLDYHGDFEGYFNAKASLFRRVGEGSQSHPPPAAAKRGITKTAVLNHDDDSYPRLAAICRLQEPNKRPVEVLTYGLDHPASVTATRMEVSGGDNTFMLQLPGKPEVLVSPALVGRFNLYNMLAAAAVGHVLGISPEIIGRGLERVPGLTGRMEQIEEGQPFQVIVDFAHTPNALAQAIAAARRLAAGRIIVVFGSAGKRDVAKRRLMAEIAAREAELVVLTAEDPRTESLAGILDEMATGCRQMGGVEGRTYWRVPDRGRAIYHALTLARPDDLVLICGKGHEQSMCFGAVEYPWDDGAATRTALAAFLAGRPVPDLGLPTFKTA